MCRSGHEPLALVCRKKALQGFQLNTGLLLFQSLCFGEVIMPPTRKNILGWTPEPPLEPDPGQCSSELPALTCMFQGFRQESFSKASLEMLGASCMQSRCQN